MSTCTRLRHTAGCAFVAVALCCGATCNANAGPDLADLVQRAKVAAAGGDLDLARALIEPVLRSPTLEPSTRSVLHLMRARIFIDEDAPVSARLDAERAMHEDPTNGEALNLLARLYRDGNYLDRSGRVGDAVSSATASARMYLKAARQGVVEAQREAGALLLRGDGVASDLRKGRYWLEQAADAGDLPAMQLLITSYSQNADPQQRDAVRAAHWSERARRAAHSNHADPGGGGDRGAVPQPGAPAASATDVRVARLAARSNREAARTAVESNRTGRALVDVDPGRLESRIADARPGALADARPRARGEARTVDQGDEAPPARTHDGAATEPRLNNSGRATR